MQVEIIERPRNRDGFICEISQEAFQEYVDIDAHVPVADDFDEIENPDDIINNLGKASAVTAPDDDNDNADEDIMEKAHLPSPKTIVEAMHV